MILLLFTMFLGVCSYKSAIQSLTNQYCPKLKLCLHQENIDDGGGDLVSDSIKKWVKNQNKLRVYFIRRNPSTVQNQIKMFLKCQLVKSSPKKHQVMQFILVGKDGKKKYGMQQIQKMVISLSIFTSLQTFQNMHHHGQCQVKTLAQSYNRRYKVLEMRDNHQWVSLAKQFILWEDLECLVIASCGASDYSVFLSGISKHPMPKLKHLQVGNEDNFPRINYSYITQNGLSLLLQHESRELETLDLFNTRIGDDGAKMIMKKYYPVLSALCLNNCMISEAGLKSLPSAKFTGLKELLLNNNKIGMRGAKIIIKCNFNQLQVLRLYNCQIGAEGNKYISKGKWPKIKTIVVHSDESAMKFDGCSAIATGNWKKLKQFQFNNRMKWNKHHPIEFFWFLLSNWPKKMQNQFCLNPKFAKKSLNKMMMDRFSCADELTEEQEQQYEEQYEELEEESEEESDQQSDQDIQ